MHRRTQQNGVDNRKARSPKLEIIWSFWLTYSSSISIGHVYSAQLTIWRPNCRWQAIIALRPRVLWEWIMLKWGVMTTGNQNGEWLTRHTCRRAEDGREGGGRRWQANGKTGGYVTLGAFRPRTRGHLAQLPQAGALKWTRICGHAVCTWWETDVAVRSGQ